MRTLACCLLIALVLIPGTAAALQLEVEYTGVVYDWDADLGSEFADGESVRVVYRYRPARTNCIPDFCQTDVMWLRGEFGDYAFEVSDPTIALHNDTTTFGDQVFVRGGLVGAPVGVAAPAVFLLSFRDFDGELFAQADEFVGAPDLSLLEVSGIALGFDDPTAAHSRVLVRSRTILTASARVVPEPSAAALFSGAFVLVLARLRSARR